MGNAIFKYKNYLNFRVLSHLVRLLLLIICWSEDHWWSLFFSLQLKISFNESSLHSTYEYPSESSVWDSGDEEEEEQEEELPSMVGRIHIPRPSIITSPTHSNSSGETRSHCSTTNLCLNWIQQKGFPFDLLETSKNKISKNVKHENRANVFIWTGVMWGHIMTCFWNRQQKGNLHRLVLVVMQL